MASDLATLVPAAARSTLALVGDDLVAFVAPDQLLVWRTGRLERRAIAPPRAVCAGPRGIAVLDTSGHVAIHGASVEPCWRLSAPNRGGLSAVSPDGRWVFDDGALVSETARAAPFEIDFFHRWTFARFVSGDAIALAFESDQPWSEYGSYGHRYGGVQIDAVPGDPTRWSLLSIEHSKRRHDEAFVPLDAVWHPRGVTAWFRERELYVQVLDQPRGPVEPDSSPCADSSVRGARTLDRWPEADALTLDDDGRWLAASGRDGVTVLDLETWREATIELACAAVALRRGALLAIDQDGACTELALADLAWQSLETYR